MLDKRSRHDGCHWLGILLYEMPLSEISKEMPHVEEVLETFGRLA